MTVPETRATEALPGPRTTEPWTEPAHLPRGTRARSEYWDVMNARWTSRPAIPGPRKGD